MKNCNYCEHLNLTEEQQHKAGTVKFLYELDNDGRLVEIVRGPAFERENHKRRFRR